MLLDQTRFLMMRWSHVHRKDVAEAITIVRGAPAIGVRRSRIAMGETARRTSPNPRCTPRGVRADG